MKLLISNIKALVQPAGSSLKTQPRLLLLPIIMILSWLDYCICILIGTPNSVIQPLRKIQNFAARLVPLAPATTTQHLSWKKLPVDCVKPWDVRPTLHASGTLQNKSVVCSGSRVTSGTVIKSRGSVNQGGITVKTCTNSTCPQLICIMWALRALMRVW